VNNGYVPRATTSSPLHRAVRENVETFLVDAAARSAHGFGVPRFVENELRGFLRCGVLAYGFARVRCGVCGDELFVGFSCKARAVCTSCTGRRASECAAKLVDDVLPSAPVRQWVLTFPRGLRFLLARDSALCTKTIGIWLRALASFHRRRARREGFSSTRTGAVTFAQRFGSALNLNVHFHTVLPDGVFTIPAPDEERPSFVALDPPSRDEIDALLTTLVRRVRRAVERALAGRDDDAADVMASLAASSVAPRGASVDLARPRGRFESFLDGFSLHCGVRLHENDRDGIERLCRYGARGPLTLGRLTRDDDGRYRYRMKRTVRGRAELVMSGLELVQKLAVLIPPPRIHLVRFHGVFAPNAKLRSLVVPKQRKPGIVVADEATIPLPPKMPRAFRIDWASLLKRVFAVDVLRCEKCEGRRRVLAVVDEPGAVKKILEHVGLPSTPVTTAPARGPPQPSFAFEGG
jgi:hypothetical protein